VTESFEYLDALLEIYKGDVEAEDVAWEPRHVLEQVAGVGDGQDPVEDKRPAITPRSQPPVLI